MPTPNTLTRYITAGPDGALWFTENVDGGGQVGRITTTGVVTEYGNNAGSVFYFITPGPDGALWFSA